MERPLLHAFFSELKYIEKEAGLGRDLLAWAKKRHRAARQLVSKADTLHRETGIKLYTKLPEQVQKAVTNPQLMDPSDPSGGIALRAAKSLVKMGSRQQPGRRA